jgi:hypothetical protein
MTMEEALIMEEKLAWDLLCSLVQLIQRESCACICLVSMLTAHDQVDSDNNSFKKFLSIKVDVLASGTCQNFMVEKSKIVIIARAVRNR